MKAKLLVGLAMSGLLFGCANTAELETQVETLSNKVDSLADQVGALRSDHAQMNADINAAKSASMEAQEEAARANARIDNMASGYSKK